MSGVGGRALFLDIYILNKHNLKTKNKRLGSKIYGISLMKFFHPDGYKYCDEMNGICNIFLVNEPADILLNRKKEIRKEYASLNVMIQ